MTRNIFVLGLDDFNLAQLRQLRKAGEYRFYSLCSASEVKAGPDFPVHDILMKSRQILEDFSGQVDAIVGYWDFPVSTLLPLLRKPLHLPGPSLEATLKCEHKYWSRVEQQAVVPALIPEFCAVDPFRDDAVDLIHLPYPFWLKPVKAASSHLGFRIHNEDELLQALKIIRARIGRFGNPFNEILRLASLPPMIAGVDGQYCIAEGIISDGEQCTLEGYVHHGEVVVYGVVDSIREGGHASCFARYQYPSMLPETVQARMCDAAKRFLGHIGYDDSPFNMEFYWEPDSDRIWLLEVNTRISKSHCPLFKMVDGEYHHAVMIEVALGKRPEFPRGGGKYRTAAKFMLREYHDALVGKIPDDDAIRRVQERFPDSSIQLHVQPGMRLSELLDQDSYSYETAVMFMGADSPEQLLDNYHQAREMLSFEFEEVPAA